MASSLNSKCNVRATARLLAASQTTKQTTTLIHWVGPSFSSHMIILPWSSWEFRATKYRLAWVPFFLFEPDPAWSKTTPRAPTNSCSVSSLVRLRARHVDQWCGISRVPCWFRPPDLYWANTKYLQYRTWVYHNNSHRPDEPVTFLESRPVPGDWHLPEL